MEEGAPRGGMDETHRRAPGVAVLDRSEGALVVKAPDLAQDRLQADAVLVHRPQLDLRLREGGGHLPQKRAELFLKAAWATGSAWTWRGRGTRRRPPRRRTYTQPK